MNNYDYDDYDDDFIESSTAKRKYRNTNDDEIDIYYTEDQVKTAWIYPLTTLTGNKIKDGVNVSSEKITIMCTTPDKGKKITIYMSEEMDFDLIEIMDPNSVTEKILKNQNSIQFNCPQMPDLNFDELYMLTFEELTTSTDMNNVKIYLSKTITPSDETGAECSFDSIEEFVNSFRTIGVRVVLTEPLTSKIKQISITSPVGALIGNIKPINESGRFPDLYPTNNTEVYPKLVFPFQVQPTLNLINYWASDQIIPLKDIFDYLKSEGIGYDQEFSLAGFLKLGDSGNQPTIRYDNVSEITFDVKQQKSKINSSSGEIGYVQYNGWEDETTGTWTFKKDTEIFTSEIVIATSSYNNSADALAHKYKINSIYNANITPKNALVSTSAFEVLCKMITESFWKDYEFEGATRIKKETQELVIDDEKIYKLMDKYAQQDRYAVTTNNWLSWKRINNSAYVLQNQNIVKRIESAMSMLSGAFKSNFCINKGDNDDYKILLPYYFELQNSIDNPQGYVEYKDLKVKLKSSYFEFKSDSIIPFNESISNNKIHKLEINHYVFPEMTKNTETASIPSSMPVDQQLANGEYSKYQVKQFNKSPIAINVMKADYGSTNINFNPLNQNYVGNDGDFVFKDTQKIKEIIISAFYGAGLWRISLIDENLKTFNLDLQLFDKSNSLNNFLNLII